MPAHTPKLLDQVRQALHIKHYVIRGDFAQRQITVRSGKGNKDRATLLPDGLNAPLQRQLRYVQVSIRTISNKAMGVSSCRMRWRASIPMSIARGVGGGVYRGGSR